MNRFENTFDLSKNKILRFPSAIAVQAMSKQQQKVTAKYQQKMENLFISFAHKNLNLRFEFVLRRGRSRRCCEYGAKHRIHMKSIQIDIWWKWYDLQRPCVDFFDLIWNRRWNKNRWNSNFSKLFHAVVSKVAELVAGCAGLSKYWYILIFQN